MTDSNDKGGRRPGRPGADSRGPARKPPRPRTGETLPDLEAEGIEIEPVAEPAKERIAKVIARAGIASRRDAEALIADGRVTLNGQRLDTPAVTVGSEDAITIDGEALPSRERTRLWLFHKPRGLVTTFKDPEGRATVFDSLPEDMPRVVAIGRLDINTEGLLLLTNDGGLAKVVAHPETGWTRRYRVRAHGDTSQAELDKLKKGITVDGMDYGPIEASLDRVQGDNMWLTLALREGKNREVKRVLEHLGIQVNRLIRLSFGPFQLGDIEPGLVEEVRTRVLKDQLGAALATEAGVDFESPVREPIAPFGKPERRDTGKAPRPRNAAEPQRRYEDGRGTGQRAAGRPERPARRDEGGVRRPREERRPVWRSDEDGDERMRRPAPRREDPRGDREASAARPHARVGAIADPGGRRVLVERVVAEPREERPRRDRSRGQDEGGGRPVRREGGPPRREGGSPRREGGAPRQDHGKPRGEGGSFREERSGGAGRDRPGGRPGFGDKAGGRGGFGERPGGRPGFGGPGKPKFGGSRPGGAKPGGFKAGGFKGGGFSGGGFSGDRPAGGRPAGGRPGGAGGRPGGGSRTGGPPRGRRG